MKRRLRYSFIQNVELKNNQQHMFAQNHALNIFGSKSIYSFIPKNACSTFRLSLALENGCIDSQDDFEWIHKNNDTFSANLQQLLTADYTFCVLRCPYRRIASVFLDKIISKDKVAWSYFDASNRKADLDTLSFSKFIRSLKNIRILNTNHHWKPQVSFLVYQEYDDYFSVENIAECSIALKNKIDFKLVDARGHTKHGIEQYVKLTDQFYGKMRAVTLSNQKVKKLIPDYKNMYDEELKLLVDDIYGDDIAMYKNTFGSSDLLFN